MNLQRTRSPLLTLEKWYKQLSLNWVKRPLQSWRQSKKNILSHRLFSSHYPVQLQSYSQIVRPNSYPKQFWPNPSHQIWQQNGNLWINSIKLQKYLMTKMQSDKIFSRHLVERGYKMPDRNHSYVKKNLIKFLKIENRVRNRILKITITSLKAISQMTPPQLVWINPKIPWVQTNNLQVNTKGRR